MKKLYILIVMGLSIILGLQSCKPDDSNPIDPRYFKAPQEVLDYCYFKEGSYWIYRDSVSGQRDTVYVISSNFDTLINNNEGVTEYYDIFLVTTYSSFDKYNVNIRLQDRPWLVTGAPIVFYTKYKPGDVKGTTVHHFYPYKVGSINYGTSDIITLIDTKPKYDILQNSFNSTLIYQHSKDPNYDYSSTVIYQAKNIGTIKKVIKAKNQVWELIEYNIVQ